MMMETIKKTTTFVIVLITSHVMAQGIYGDDIPYPNPGPELTEDQSIVRAIDEVDDELIRQFNVIVKDSESSCAVTAEKNGKPYYSIVFSDCEGVSGELASVPVSGWNTVNIPEEERRELVSKRKFSKQIHKKLDVENCKQYEQCSQTTVYTLLFTDYRAANAEDSSEFSYMLNVEIKTTQRFWDVITEEPVTGPLPKRRYGTPSVETINLVLNY